MSISRAVALAAPPNELAADYWSVFRKHVFSLVQMGHSRLDRQALQMAQEEDITGELQRAIAELLDSDAPSWADAYSICEEPRVHAPDRRGKRRRRLDLRFERVDSRPRPHYEFECKRLCKDKSGVADYFGQDGMALFLSGEYASGWPEAGMLGYVQTDSPEEWAQKLERKLEGANIEVTDQGKWQSIDLVAGLKTYATAHPRIAPLPSIRIVHAVLSMV